MRVRLGTKLAAATTLGIAVVLVGTTLYRIERERTLFEEDRQRDHSAIGRALVAATEAVAARGNLEDALAVVEDANLRRSEIDIRWRPLGSEDRVLDLPTTASFRADAAAFTSSFPVELAGTRGVIEVSEPRDRQDAYLRETLRRTSITALALIAACALVIYASSWFFVGRAVRKLSLKMHRIARGDLEGPLEIRQGDEMDVIADELNAMCEQLDASRASARQEMEGRIAALEELRHSERLATVGKLAAGLAHELGTPLNVVAARAKLIAQGKTQPERVPRDAGIIVEQTERMTGIIRQLLDFARRREPQKTREDVAAIARRTQAVLEPLAGKQGVALELEVAEADTSALVDAGQLAQVLTNLVMNAIQAQPEGGRVRVRLSCSDEAAPADVPAPGGGLLRIDVEDGGPGVPPELAAKIFEPFFTTKGVGEGTGLGLSVVHGIVREHGGWITLEDGTDGGSRFSVRLPRGAS